MDLSNKEIDIEFMTSDMLTGSSKVTVSISHEISEGVIQRIATYKLEFTGQSFSSMSDPNLLVALQEKLESIPEPA
jgi:hypothetical protein